MYKNLIAVAVLAMSAVGSFGQVYYQDAVNKDMIRPANRISGTRSEFILPETINGYMPLRTELHLHTYFSDADVSPAARVREAWLDGLDIVAITDHIEYHPTDAQMIAYLGTTLPEGIKAHEVNKNPDMKPKQDFNYSVKLAEAAAKQYGLLIIPGTEVTRAPETIGHYNALFTKDNNEIYNADPLQSLRNAKAQNALVLHNHPGWRRTSIDYTEFQTKAYGENLIDGIEVNNGVEMYPGAMNMALDNNLFVASTTDMHATSFETYQGRGLHRNMTILLAKDFSLESAREALESNRTIAYVAGGTLVGRNELLKELFDNSIVIEKISDTRMKLTNKTSLHFIFKTTNGNPVVLPEMSSIIIGKPADGPLHVMLENWWTGVDSHLEVDLTF